jgi:hypothetical protein
MEFVHTDGGRAAAGFKGTAGDCACRAIAIVSGRPYREVYDELNAFGTKERPRKWKTTRSSARTGVWKDSLREYLLSQGYVWTATMKIGQGCLVHLRKEELPTG